MGYISSHRPPGEPRRFGELKNKMKKINTVEVLVVMDDNETYCPIDGCMYIAVTKEELKELKSGATKVKELMDYEGRKVPFIPPELKESVPPEVKELLSKG